MLGLGLFLYDRLGGRSSLPRSARVRLDEGATSGQLKPEYRIGFRYSDCRVDDARLVLALALDAQARGAAVLTRTTCAAARRDGEGWRLKLQPDDAAPVEVRARAVVNAAGAWAQSVREMGAPAPAPREKLRLVKGSHIVTRRLYAGDHAFLFQNADGRVIFAIPYEGDFTLIGTTDIPVATAEEGERIGDAEIAYLCAAASEYLAAPVTPGDVVWTFAGVRALADDGDANPSNISRDDALLLDAGEDGRAAPMLSVFGGKLTTHRRVAERALGRLAQFFPGMGAAWTADAVLPGGDIGAGPEAFADTLLSEYEWAPPPMLRRMAGAYGSRTRDVLGDARGLPDLGRYFGADLYERELAYMIEHEFARTAEDVLWRRSKRGLVLSPEQRRAVAEWVGA